MIRQFLFLLALCAVLSVCKGNEKPAEQPEAETELAISAEPDIDELQPAEGDAELADAALTASASSANVQVSSHVQRTLPDLRGIGGRVNTREIDPINYENPDLDILRQMGAQQYVISFLAGEQFYKTGDYDNALLEYTNSINNHGEFIEAVLSRGNTWLKKKEYSRAIDDYNRAIRLDGSRAELFNYRGFARMELAAEISQNSLREYNLAIEDFSRAISLNENYTDALINRSYVFFLVNNFDRVIEDCNCVISLEPDNASIWNRRGSAYYHKGDDGRAINDFSQAIKIKSDYAAAFYNRGNVLYSIGEYDKALADIDRTLAINPSFTGAAVLRENILLMKR